jgi:hypothetical protein
MSKVYLNAIGTNTFEWVDKLEKAIPQAKEAVEVTLKQLRGTELEQAPRKTEIVEPGWIISREA